MGLYFHWQIYGRSITTSHKVLLLKLIFMKEVKEVLGSHKSQL